MLRPSPYPFIVLFLLGTLLNLPVRAQSAAGSVAATPPPPGPYLSSRPQLDMPSSPRSSNNRIPFVGTMPMMPMMPMRGMPLHNYYPAPAPWWRDPMGQ